MQTNYLHPLTFKMTVSLFVESVKGHQFFRRDSTFDHLYLLNMKSREIISNAYYTERKTQTEYNQRIFYKARMDYVRLLNSQK